MNNSYTNNSLFILLFNANGLKNHVNELQTMLFDKRIGIALISETHFTKYSHIFISDYNLLKSNHPDGTVYGGTGILIKTNFKFHLFTSFSQNHIQSCAISIIFNNIPIVVTEFYSPSTHLININLTTFFDTIPNNFIAGGDYNAKHQSWGCRVTNYRGNLLYNFINVKNYQILSLPDPTYWPTSLKKKPDILNIFVSKIPSNLYYSVNNILDLNSDSPFCSISHQTSSVIHTLFSPSINHFKFHSLIAHKTNLSISLKSENDIHEAVNNLSKLIHTAVFLSNTLITTKNTAHKQTNISEQIRSLIVKKHRARARCQHTRLPSHKSAYSKLANLLKKILTKNKSNIFEQKLSNISYSNDSV